MLLLIGKICSLRVVPFSILCVCVGGGGGGGAKYSTVLKLLFDTDTNLLGMAVHFCVLSSCFRNCISWSHVSAVVVYIAN